MTGNELREAYLRYFEEHCGHLRLPSFSLIPENDKSLLLIGAGMAPLKPFFTGKMKPPRTRITTCQRSVRTGDIENVGHTARHQTYFEMLGNFSFGDYFKQDAITWAWDFLTNVVELPKEKLWVTIYPKDDEAAAIWKTQPGFDTTHIVKLDDNFWEIGPGPCGPDSEIYIDLGEERGCGSPDCKPGCDCDRYLEIWNLVFTQFDRTEGGEYIPLAHKNIDTGCGLERLASVLQRKPSNFETDLLFPIIEYAAKLAGKTYGADHDTDVSLKVIADHARSMAIMIMDGILPSNEGRGYVLRRILRRAVRHGRLLGITDTFLPGAVDAVVAIYKGAPDFDALVAKQEYIKRVVQIEEERFHATLQQGMALLDNLLASSGKMLDGAEVFKLYDTYGFPWELTEEIAKERGCDIDKAAFEREMAAQRERARAARKANERCEVPDLRDHVDITALRQDMAATSATVVAICKDGKLVDVAADGDEVGLVLDVTPFYAEGGGQVGDSGTLRSEFGLVNVSNAQKLPDGTVYHVANVVEGGLKRGERVTIEIDAARKLASSRNHTATHLLQAALKRVVGDQVNQAGSLVTPERLRFDFSNFEPVSEQQLADVEALVNAVILRGQDVAFEQMSQGEARAKGAMALFGEKYGDVVRVVSVPGFSMELCGGCHVSNVGQIGAFKIVSETGVAAGVRRIEAVTGAAALAIAKRNEAVLATSAALLKCQPDEVAAKLTALMADVEAMRRELEQVHKAREKADTQKLLMAVEKIGAVQVVRGRANAASMDELREMADLTCDKLDTGLAILAAVFDGKVSLVAKASKSAVAAGVHAGKIVKAMSAIVGGGGGGRPEMAQAGGKLVDKLPEAMDKSESLIREQLKL